ncbi:MAG: DUF2250 domain-containing protein [Candidatus Desulforudis sp.]|nr:DUF2250 domain-containing protein [Desulforudis sp.]
MRMMYVFDSRYLGDDEIWSRLGMIAERRDQVRRLLARPEVSTDPETTPGLAGELHKLDQICLLADELKRHLQDRHDLEEMSLGRGDADADEFRALCEEYAVLCRRSAGELYRLLLEEGYIDEETEDETDLEILKFIDYAGPEYAWRLGINIGLDVAEARERLEKLLGKGLLERVEGTMLDNYHRQKDWSKHMNHTYYRVSRAGRHYLRRLRRA